MAVAIETLLNHAFIVNTRELLTLVTNAFVADRFVTVAAAIETILNEAFIDNTRVC